MKRITRILMLCLAVVLAACQAEEIIVPAEQTPQTLSFKATIGEQTRVSYTNDDATGNIKLAWEIGDIVKLYENNLEKATFYLTEIDGATATFVCDDTYNIASIKSTVSGTRLEYVKPSGDDMIQTSNDNIDHLKYANNLTATLPTGTDLTAEGLTFTFNHSILIYKIVLENVPSDVLCGSVLSMNNYNGDETYYFNFALTLGNKSNDVFVAKGGTLTAYIPGTGYTGAFPKGTTQTFTLPAYDGIYTYTATISYEDGIKYENGKMYIANLSSIEPTVQPQINGHEWVDLGLRLSDVDTSITPGSTADRRIVFAKTNIGAENPGDLGYYFSWGDLRGITSSSIPHKSAPYNLIDNYELIDKDGNIEVCDEDYPAVGSAEHWAINKIDEALDIQGHTNLRGFGYIYHKDASGNAYCTPAYYGDAAKHFWGKGWVMMSKEVADVLNAKITEQRRGTNNYDLTQSRMYLRYKNEDNTYNEVIIPHSGYLSVTEKKLTQLTTGYEMYGEYWTTKPDDSNKDQAYAVRFNSYTRGSENTTKITTSKKNRVDARTIRPIAYLPLDSNTPVEWKSDITLPDPTDEFQRFDFGKHGWKLSIVSNEDEGFKVDLDAQTTEDKIITATFPKAGNVTLSFKHSVSGTGDGQYELNVYVGDEVKGTYTLGATATPKSISLTGVTADTQVRWEVSTTTAPTAGTNTALISGVALSYGN